MRVISTADELSAGTTLYHSAFGFAVVDARMGDDVVLTWEHAGPHLPRRVNVKTLRRIYRRCPEGGFFDRAMREPDALKHQLLASPSRALVALLEDLGAPTRTNELMDWIVGRNLLSSKNFVRWWRGSEDALRSDPQLLWRGDRLHLREEILEDNVQLKPGLIEPPDDETEETDETDGEDLEAIATFDDSEASSVLRPTPLADLSHHTIRLEELGHATCEALQRTREAGSRARIDRLALMVLPDGSAIIDQEPGEPRESREVVPLAAQLLLEWLIGRDLPPGLSPCSMLPFLRHRLPRLSPSSLGPLAAAFVDAPPTLSEWHGMWVHALVAEQGRKETSNHPLDMACDSHIGRVKLLATQTNQDALAFARRAHHLLAGVFDGISTADVGSGDRASHLSARTVMRTWELQHATTPPRRWIPRALRRANRVVCSESTHLADGALLSRMPMGSTATVVAAEGNSLHLAWLGDSRAYLISPAGAAQLTADDNVSGERFQRWCDGTAPTWSPEGHPLVRFVGHFDVEGQQQAIPPHIFHLRLLPGERLLLCTDGLTDYLADTEAGRCEALRRLVLGPPLERIPGLLILEANIRGGGDNISVIVLENKPPGGQTER